MTDVNDVINVLERIVQHGGAWGCASYHAIQMLRERKEGKCVYDRPGHWHCSECNYMEGRISHSQFRQYCPVCGARMSNWEERV